MNQVGENFETRLLRELQALVAERPAPPVRSRAGRRLLPAAAVAASGAAVAAGVLVVSDAGGPTPAYAVTRSADGTVTVEIRSLRDATGLQRKLGAAGVRAKVDYLPAGKMCREPRFTPARGHGKFTSGVRVRKDGTAAFSISPARQAADETLVITSGTGGPANARPANSLSIALARGKVAPCVPVKDTRPAPPTPPSGSDDRGPRLNQSFGPDRGLQQGE